MRKFFSYLRIIFTAGIPIIFYHFAYMIRYSKHPEKYPLELRFARVQKLIRLVLRKFRVDFHIEGVENRTNKTERAIYFSNHLSDIDPLILIAISDTPVTFVAKEEALKLPFANRFIRALEGIPLDRKNVMNQLDSIREIVSDIRDPKKGEVVIYPEGTRSHDEKGHTIEFKGGSFKLGYMAGNPIIPITVFGTQRILSIHSYLKRYPVFIKFGKPVYKEEYKKIQSVEMADRVRAEIEDNIKNYKPIDKAIVDKQRLSKKRKAKETFIDID